MNNEICSEIRSNFLMTIGVDVPTVFFQAVAMPTSHSSTSPQVSTALRDNNINDYYSNYIIKPNCHCIAIKY